MCQDACDCEGMAAYEAEERARWEQAQEEDERAAYYASLEAEYRAQAEAEEDQANKGRE